MTNNLIPALSKFIAIPNQSRDFDPEWKTNGLIEQAVDHVTQWVNQQNINGLTLERLDLPDASPLLFIDIPGTRSGGGILMYGHLDKQPPMSGWTEGLDPYIPIQKDGRLYGRGSVDDGYSIFAGLVAVKACLEQGVPLPRLMFILESEEESGSPNLEAFINLLSPKLGTPELFICLDSRARIYDRLWQNASLRGIVNVTLTVKVLESPIHSGAASGIVPSSFRIIRILLDRIEDSETGRIKLPELNMTLTPEIYANVAKTLGIIGTDAVRSQFNLPEGMSLTSEDFVQQYIAGTYMPTLSVTGVEGIPSLANAGNVLRTHTSLKLSIRLPPGVEVETASRAVRQTLLADPPYGATVSVTGAHDGPGFLAPPLPEAFEANLNDISKSFFGGEFTHNNGGGSIPVMSQLKNRFPDSSILCTGVIGPLSNPHGTDECVDLEYLRKFTCALAHVMALKIKD